MADDPEKEDRIELLSQILVNLETRISRIEQQLNLEPVELKKKMEVAAIEPDLQPKETLELQIGLYWFAKVGIVALITGIVFLLLQPYHGLHPAFAAILGYILAGTVTLFSRYLRKSSPFLSGYLLGSGLVLFFFATLRLHYFSAQPVISSRLPEVILLLLVVSISLFISTRQKSIYLAAVSLTMGCATALMSEQMYSFFAIIIVMAAVAIHFTLKYKWYNLIIYGIVLTYLSYFVWFINDPIIGNSIELRASPYGSALFILLLIVIFASGIFLQGRELKEDFTVIVSSFLNGLWGYGLYFLVTVTKFQGLLTLSHLIASLVFIVLGMAFWVRRESRYQTFFYAMIGYAALSVAIVAQFKTPDSFIWLCWQSLLVVSTAIWFRSKFIVVTNFIIYILIFITYLVLAGTVSVTSLSFGVVALVSARVLNWQKHRLDLKTEKMRTAYLVAAFFIFPYALYHTVPTDYVSLSWLGVALVYYIISLILKNMKYRWMALLTFLLAALYLLVIGIIKLEPVYRIVSFLILGVVLLVISFVYARTKMRSSSKET